MAEAVAMPAPAPRNPPSNIGKLDQHCENCEYFYPASASEAVPTDSAGWCLFYPPAAIMAAPVGSSTRGNPDSFYREVKLKWWCGQWKALTTPWA